MDSHTTEMILRGFVYISLIGVVLIVLFILTRKYLLWYWKLDKIEAHLAQIRKNTARELRIPEGNEKYRKDLEDRRKELLG